MNWLLQEGRGDGYSRSADGWVTLPGLWSSSCFENGVAKLAVTILLPGEQAVEKTPRVQHKRLIFAHSYAKSPSSTSNVRGLLLFSSQFKLAWARTGASIVRERFTAEQHLRDGACCHLGWAVATCGLLILACAVCFTDLKDSRRSLALLAPEPRSTCADLQAAIYEQASCQNSHFGKKLLPVSRCRAEESLTGLSLFVTAVWFR